MSRPQLRLKSQPEPVAPKASSSAATAVGITTPTIKWLQVDDVADLPITARDASQAATPTASAQSNDDDDTPNTALVLDVLLVALPTEVLKASPLHVNEGDGRAIIGMDMSIATTPRREHSSLWNIAHPPPAKARQLLNRIKASVTQPKPTTVDQRQEQRLQDDRADIYSRLNSATRDWLKKSMKIRLILTLGDFVPQNLFANYITLGELLSCGSKNTGKRGEPLPIKFMDWVSLFQLKRADAEQWLAKLGYMPYLHGVYPSIFPGSDVVLMGLHWDQIRRNKIFWPPLDTCLRYTLLPSARDWLDLGFRLPSAQEGMTRDIFMHLAYYGAWTFEDCLEMGLSSEVVNDIGLTCSDFEYLASEEDMENADKMWPAEKIAALFVDIEVAAGGGECIDSVVNGLLEDEERQS